MDWDVCAPLKFILLLIMTTSAFGVLLCLVCLGKILLLLDTGTCIFSLVCSVLLSILGVLCVLELKYRDYRDYDGLRVYISYIF